MGHQEFFERKCGDCGRGLRSQGRFCYKCKKLAEQKYPTCEICKKRIWDKKGELYYFAGGDLLNFCCKKCLDKYLKRKRRKKLKGIDY